MVSSFASISFTLSLHFYGTLAALCAALMEIIIVKCRAGSRASEGGMYKKDGGNLIQFLKPVACMCTRVCMRCVTWSRLHATLPVVLG